ncbi:MAG: hypothetical protein VX609_04040, partial [Verrucomicrobiota bacterium]|nr:hypothetical protein [Verrucomicrobiota bacterium]
MDDFKFPDPPDPNDLPWWRRIPQMYYWWGLSIVLLAIAFIWLPSQCTMDAFNLPQGKVDDLEGFEKVNQDKDLEFREDQVWYKLGDEVPFTGVALSYHENGKIRYQTKIK